ncbi:hypothetical protein M408DRAFT_332979 [Serendipita vermifera MAFF 305830]|uniref:Hemerythrin-like domain-containing protein n=1 Tax=Serendipita vermifera MAFF 305830 TaxID=933852 RepID=A0A0C3AQE2_SERVB|nr:hypothetical protein M408DRAFT_332979 [Serendipita vermifera MAFF 305830]
MNFNDRCNKSRPLFAKYSSEPRPNDPYARIRWSMSGTHLLILEILQNIYNKVDTIPPEQQEDFALFSLYGTQVIVQHHRMEENFFFPALEPEFKTEVLEEHAAFEKAVHGLDEYLKSVLGVKQGRKNGQVIRVANQPKEPFNSATIKQFLEDLVDPLFTHLEHEIGWLDPENLRASGLQEERLRVLNDRTDDTVGNELDILVLVFFYGHKPPYCRFPHVPWLIENLVIPGVFKARQRRLWKFLPQTFTQV